MIIQLLVQSFHTVNRKSICRKILLLGQYNSFLIIKEAIRSLKICTTSQVFFSFVVVLAVGIYLETLMLKQVCNTCGQSNAA